MSEDAAHHSAAESKDPCGTQYSFQFSEGPGFSRAALGANHSRLLAAAGRI